MAPLHLGTPTAPIPDLRALIGQALFIMLTEPEEGMNANRNLRRALEQGSLDVIEVLDNAAWVFVSRSGAARVDVLHPLLTDERPHLGALFHEAEARLRGASTPRASGRQTHLNNLSSPNQRT